MDKKTVMALVLIGIVFLLWPVYMKKVVGVKDVPPQEISQVQDQEPDVPLTAQIKEPAVTPRQPAKSVERNVSRQKIKRAANKEPVFVTLQNDLFRGVLSSVGGGTIVSWQLKDHFIQLKNKDKEWVELITDSAYHNLSIVSSFGDYDFANTVFDVQYDTLGQTKTYRFVYQLDRLKSVEKVFVVYPGSYVVDMSIHFRLMEREDIGDSYFVDWATGLMPTEPNIKDDQFYYQAYALQGEDLLKTKKNKKSNNGST